VAWLRPGTQGDNGAAMTDRPRPASALGIDAGGTATRWALMQAAPGGPRLVAEGEAAAASGLQLLGDEGRAGLKATLQSIATALPLRPAAVWAGVTGLGTGGAGGAADFAALLHEAFDSQARAMSDIELLCRAAGARRIVLYAGTGAIAAGLDDAGELQRAGGRGPVIDDAGGGHWIASQALRRVWRAEDEAPGAWRASPLAQALFARIGGHEWQHTREWVHGSARGGIGRLALAVAESAPHDAGAMALLDEAGRELARLARALLRRLGERPVVLAGRVWTLHPAIEASLRAGLPHGVPVERLAEPAHHAAARLALDEAPASR